MKRKLLFAIVALLCSVGSRAEITSGSDYLIKNVETGYYLVGGMDYGTHACLHAMPQWFTLTESNGAYTMDSHQFNGKDVHFLATNLYVDGASTEWTFTETATSGIYTIKNGVNYLAGNGVDVAITTTTDGTSSAAQWQLIDKSTFESSLSSATPSAGVDATPYIKDPELKRNGNFYGWSDRPWTITGYDGTGTPANFNQGSGGNNASCSESFQSSNGFKATQTLTGLKPGQYKLKAQAFYRQDGSDTENYPYLFVGDQKNNFPVRTGTENSMAAAYASFLSGTYPVDPITFVVKSTSDQISIGYANANAMTWNIFGQTQLTYYGTCLVNDAVELTNGGTMTANKWYYYDVVGGNYTAAATTVGDIVYTTDGEMNTVTANESVSTALTASPTLTTTRYYFKSSSEQTLTLTNTDAAPFANGTYYLKVYGQDLYMSRAGNWGTEAATDIYGIALTATRQDDGKYTLKAVDVTAAVGADRGLNYGGATGGSYTDSGTLSKWIFKASTNGYYLMPTGTEYINTGSYAIDRTYNYIAATTNVEEAIEWQLVSASDYNTNLATRLNTQAAAVATAAGLSSTTVSELEAAISKWTTTDYTSYISNPTLTTNIDGWTSQKYANWGAATPGSDGNACEVWNRVAGLTQTVADLPEGLYKVTVDACYRLGSKDNALAAAGNADVTAFFSANTGSATNVSQIKSWYSYSGTRPSDRATFAAVASNYRNTIYVYVDEGEDLTLTIGAFGGIDKNWMPFMNWTLTRLSEDPTAETKALIAENKGDITSLINGDFTESANGWTGGTRVSNLGRNWRGEGINPFYEVNATTGITDGHGTMTCTLSNMPAGTYKVVAASRTYSGGKMKAQVAGGEYGTEITGTGHAAPTTAGAMEINTNGVEMPYSSLGGFTTVDTGHNWHWITATGTLAADGDLVINFEATGTDWMAIDDVHLYCTSLDGTNYTYTIDNSNTSTGSAVVTADIILSNPNTLIYSDAAVTTAAGAGLNNNLYKPSGFGGAYRIDKMVLYDGYAYTKASASKGLYITTATLYRKFPADTWCTLTVPFWPTTSLTKMYPTSLSDQGVLTFSTVERKVDDAIAWGNDKPMLVKSATTLTSITGVRGGDGAGGVGTGDNELTSGSGVNMMGTYSALDAVPTGDYVVARVDDADALYKVNNTVTLAPFRAYFTIPAADVKAQVIRFNFDDTATAIENIETPEATKDAVIFNLAGQRVNKAQKGIYIINGKKVLVK